MLDSASRLASLRRFRGVAEFRVDDTIGRRAHTAHDADTMKR